MWLWPSWPEWVAQLASSCYWTFKSIILRRQSEGLWHMHSDHLHFCEILWSQFSRPNFTIVGKPRLISWVPFSSFPRSPHLLKAPSPCRQVRILSYLFVQIHVATNTLLPESGQSLNVCLSFFIRLWPLNQWASSQLLSLGCVRCLWIACSSTLQHSRCSLLSLTGDT